MTWRNDRNWWSGMPLLGKIRDVMAIILAIGIFVAIGACLLAVATTGHLPDFNRVATVFTSLEVEMLVLAILFALVAGVASFFAHRTTKGHELWRMTGR